MKKHKNKWKIVINHILCLDKIADSTVLEEQEKIKYLRIVWYLTKDEAEQLYNLI